MHPVAHGSRIRWLVASSWLVTSAGLISAVSRKIVRPWPNVAMYGGTLAVGIGNKQHNVVLLWVSGWIIIIMYA